MTAFNVPAGNKLGHEPLMNVFYFAITLRPVQERFVLYFIYIHLRH